MCEVGMCIGEDSYDTGQKSAVQLRNILTHVVMILRIASKNIIRKTAGNSGVYEFIVYMLLI